MYHSYLSFWGRKDSYHVEGSLTVTRQLSYLTKIWASFHDNIFISQEAGTSSEHSPQVTSEKNEQWGTSQPAFWSNRLAVLKRTQTASYLEILKVHHCYSRIKHKWWFLYTFLRKFWTFLNKQELEEKEFSYTKRKDVQRNIFNSVLWK